MSEPRNRPVHGYGRPWHRDNERAYLAMRARGVHPADAAETLRITETAAASFEAYWRQSIGRPVEWEGAEGHADERFVAAVNAAGGYPGGGWTRPDGKPWKGRVR